MDRLVTILYFCLAFISSARAASVHGRLQYPDKSPFNATTKITLNHGERSTYCKLADGCSFEIHDIPPGIHQLDVHSTTHHFGQVKIQVPDPETAAPDDDLQPKFLEYVFPGATKKVVSLPLELTAYATYEYFEQRRGFSIWMILKNPMFLMMAFSVGMMFMMPKMMEGLDPEEKAQMKQQMAMQQDPSKMLNSFFEGITGQEDTAPKLSSGAQQAKRKK